MSVGCSVLLIREQAWASAGCTIAWHAEWLKCTDWLKGTAGLLTWETPHLICDTIRCRADVDGDARHEVFGVG